MKLLSILKFHFIPLGTKQCYQDTSVLLESIRSALKESNEASPKVTSPSSTDESVESKNEGDVEMRQRKSSWNDIVLWNER